MSPSVPGSADPVKAVSVISTGTVPVVLPAHDPTAARRLLDN
jgi:hypothetical protein